MRRRTLTTSALAAVATSLMGLAGSGASASAAPAVSAASANPAASAASADPGHDELIAPFLHGPRRVRAQTIDLRRDRILVVAQGRDLNTRRGAPVGEATFAEKLQVLTNRGIPLTGINVYDWTGHGTSPVVRGNTYALWPQLRQMVDAGGSLTSEGYAHDSLNGMTAAQRWHDTCGVLGDYRRQGFEASGMYAYSGGPMQKTNQSELVNRCYSFGRQYGSSPQRLTALKAPWTLKVRSINGGCVSAGAVCFGRPGQRTYETVEQLERSFVPGPGEVSVLQYYHLVAGRSGSWDCTSAQHQTARSEIYCLSDVTGFIDGLPSDVKVATVDDLAAAVGRAPHQLPGITLEEYLRSQD